MHGIAVFNASHYYYLCRNPALIRSKSVYLILLNACTKKTWSIQGSMELFCFSKGWHNRTWTFDVPMSATQNFRNWSKLLIYGEATICFTEYLVTGQGQTTSKSTQSNWLITQNGSTRRICKAMPANASSFHWNRKNNYPQVAPHHTIVYLLQYARLSNLWIAPYWVNQLWICSHSGQTK